MECQNEDILSLPRFMGHYRRGIHYYRRHFTLTAAQKKELKENKQKDSRALFTLQQAVDDTIFPRIIGATSAKQARNTIQEEFQGSDELRNVKLHSLRREFELIRMKESETIKYYSRIKEIVSQMRAYGETILQRH